MVFEKHLKYVTNRKPSFGRRRPKKKYKKRIRGLLDRYHEPVGRDETVLEHYFS